MHLNATFYYIQDILFFDVLPSIPFLSCDNNMFIIIILNIWTDTLEQTRFRSHA